MGSLALCEALHADRHKDAYEMVRDKLWPIPVLDRVDEILDLKGEHADARPCKAREVGVDAAMRRGCHVALPRELMIHRDAHEGNVSEAEAVHGVARKADIMGMFALAR